MINETHKSRIDGIDLAFIKSANIHAYPCGRRRSELVEQDGDNNTVDDRFYFPFDPEARLNTESNNRKHSSLNGFTQTYLQDINNDDKLLTLSVAGYLFKIAGFNSINDFCSKIETALGANASESYNIYANILLEETPLFSGFVDYNTWVLRDQSNSEIGTTTLDLLTSNANTSNLKDVQDFNNYYFSGLSFSFAPLSREEGTRTTNVLTDSYRRNQQVVSLCLFEKINIIDAISGEETHDWLVHQPAYLPRVEHGDTENSVVVENLYVDYLEQNGTPIPSLKVVPVGDKYQLQFSFGARPLI